MAEAELDCPGIAVISPCMALSSVGLKVVLGESVPHTRRAPTVITSAPGPSLVFATSAETFPPHPPSPTLRPPAPPLCRRAALLSVSTAMNLNKAARALSKGTVATPAAAEHGQHIFIYSNIRTNQTVYSLQRNLNVCINCPGRPPMGCLPRFNR